MHVLLKPATFVQPIAALAQLKVITPTEHMLRTVCSFVAQ